MEVESKWWRYWWGWGVSAPVAVRGTMRELEYSNNHAVCDTTCHVVALFCI